MTERNRAPGASDPARATARDGAKLLREIEKIEDWNAERRLKARGLPESWNELAWKLPAEPAKTRVTLSLDGAVLDWFEALGPDSPGRINAVLRLYMLGVLSREIEAPDHFDWRGAPS